MWLGHHFQGQRSKVNLQGRGHIVEASRTACLHLTTMLVYWWVSVSAEWRSARFSMKFSRSTVCGMRKKPIDFQYPLPIKKESNPRDIDNRLTMLGSKTIFSRHREHRKNCIVNMQISDGDSIYMWLFQTSVLRVTWRRARALPIFAGVRG